MSYWTGKCRRQTAPEKYVRSRQIFRRLRILLTYAIPTFVVAACFAPRPTENPIPTRFYESGNGKKDYLVVFLPGRGDDIDAYERGGFIDVLSKSKRPLDAVVVDAHLGYYIDRSLGERVHEDVLVPYRKRGYQKFILVGISMGGVGALKIHYDYPDLICGTPQPADRSRRPQPLPAQAPPVQALPQALAVKSLPKTF